MRPLTLALVRQRYTPDGGAERFVERAMDALQAQGADITIITRVWRPQEGITPEICNPFYIGSLWRDWGFARAVRRLLEKKHFDLVQSHERIPGCDIYRAGDGVHREWLRQRSRALGLWGRIRLRLNPYHYYVLWAEKRLFNSKRLRAVICNSHMVKEEIKQYFPLSEDMLHVIYNGVDTQAFHPNVRHHRQTIRSQYSIPDEATLFLFVGSGFERKGVNILLEVLQQLPTSAHLLIVGRDKKTLSFTWRAQALNIHERVHFAGPQKDVKPYYGAADAFVLPTLYDPFPNAGLEAMACGLPVITSQKCGLAELINNGINGFVCDALNKHQIHAAMVSMLDIPTRRAMGENAGNTVKAMTYEKVTGELIRLYETLQGVSGNSMERSWRK